MLVVESEHLLLREKCQIIVTIVIEAKLDASIWKWKLKVSFNPKHTIVVLFIDQNILNLFLVLYQVATEGHTDFLLVIRYNHIEYFDIR
jgi:hypothetical protein